MNENVLNFINRFHICDGNVDIVFTSGCCFYFALDLFYRFIKDGAEIMYDPIACHFGTKIEGGVYDITGDVTDSYVWTPWSEPGDELNRARVVRDCIMF